MESLFPRWTRALLKMNPLLRPTNPRCPQAYYPRRGNPEPTSRL